MTLELLNIKKAFDKKQVLIDCSMKFEKGKIYGLLGRNGAGKTTLFNCLSDEVIPDGGEMLLHTENGTRKIEISDIGYLLSTPVMPDFLTGYEFLKFYMDINKKNIPQGKTIEDYLDMVKISVEDSHQLLKGYSHGMKNKMQMLCLLIARPPVILLDEPLTSLDVVVALEMKQILRHICQDHIVIFSTHILQLATDLCDEIVVLSNGVLEKIDSSLIKSKDFEKTIVEMLSDEEKPQATLQEA